MSEAKKTNKANKKILIGAAILIAAVAVLAGVYFMYAPKPAEGVKDITIEVVDNEEKAVTYEVNTDAEFLRQAMEEAEGLEFSGQESDYGLMMETVNGITANYETDGAYWSVMVNGEYGTLGIDAQPVLDGDAFQIIYTTK